MNTFSETKTLPATLTFFNVRYYIFASLFIILAIFVPSYLHQFHLLGPQFLPMHFFVLISGFLFGWRMGLIVGVSSSLLSYGISHLPPLVILPETTLELAIYGFVIGILREKGFNVWISLIVSMILGRLARLVFVLSFGLENNPLGYFKTSWPGIALQILLIPLIIALLQRHVFEGKKKERV